GQGRKYARVPDGQEPPLNHGCRDGYAVHSFPWAMGLPIHPSLSLWQPSISASFKPNSATRCYRFFSISTRPVYTPVHLSSVECMEAWSCQFDRYSYSYPPISTDRRPRALGR